MATCVHFLCFGFGIHGIEGYDGGKDFFYHKMLLITLLPNSGLIEMEEYFVLLN